MAVLVAPPAGARKHREPASAGKQILLLWRDPADIASRDLFWGPGGRAHEPHGPFTFVKEDRKGTSPKFVVRDRDGTEWKVKMGPEARPETAATRLVWAAGYFADEDYFVRELHVAGMPTRLHRGWKLVSPDGTVHDVRLERERGDKKLGVWRWDRNPFAGTRELNGLRGLMVLINNWDLKTENNSILQEGGEKVYEVSDLGASFGSAGLVWPLADAKGNLANYERSKFIRQVKDGLVDFQAPARPRFVFAVNPKAYFSRLHVERVGRGIPLEDAAWIGRLLARLSQIQIRDAFRAAGYSAEDQAAFAGILQSRIAQLTDLGTDSQAAGGTTPN